MDLRLLVVHGKPQGKEIPIHVSPFLIGRGPECHLRPNSDMISRQHCALVIHGEEVRIRDLGSTNGTIVDGERLTGELTLTDGDIFQVGVLAFQILIRPGSAAAPHAATPGAKPVGAAQSPRTADPGADADDVVQWLVGDSKSEIPTSGSGVYDGKTVFTEGPFETKATSNADTSSTPHGSDRPSAQPGKKDDHADRRGAAHDQTPAADAGRAAHAAEDLLRKFLERRPRG